MITLCQPYLAYLGDKERLPLLAVHSAGGRDVTGCVVTDVVHLVAGLAGEGSLLCGDPLDGILVFLIFPGKTDTDHF